MTTPKEERAKWVAALRSGEYKQADGRLEKINPDGTSGFCCLGVYCKIAGLERILPTTGGELDCALYVDPDTKTLLMGSLSEGSLRALGFDPNISHIGSFTLDDKIIEMVKDYKPEYDDEWVPGQKYTLAGLNDIGVPFTIIADVIEHIFREEDSAS